MNFLIINGPNLNLLGQREPGIYGKSTYTDLCALIEDYAATHGSTASFYQSNHEGAIIDTIHDAQGKYDAIILNPGAYTHYSYAIHDALKSVTVPAYEVHISDINTREEFRRISVTAPACVGQVCGLGFDGYLRAMDYFLSHGNALCVIGDPVAHSKSPRIQNAMLRHLGLESVYTANTVTTEQLPAFVNAFKRGGFLRGFNATMPHKRPLIRLLDEVVDEARILDAVNTVVLENGRAVGYNTDGQGFLAALKWELGVDPGGKTVTILGAGGAARAVAAAFFRAGAARVNVCNRSVERARDLCLLCPNTLIPAGLDALPALAASTDILVNCTSLGMTGQGQFDDLSFLSALPEGAVVCDAVYEPDETELLRAAREGGHPAMNGLGMLIHQAIYALEHFLGRELDHAELAQVARQALNQAD